MIAEHRCQQRGAIEAKMRQNAVMRRTASRSNFLKSPHKSSCAGVICDALKGNSASDGPLVDSAWVKPQMPVKRRWYLSIVSVRVNDSGSVFENQSESEQEAVRVQAHGEALAID